MPLIRSLFFAAMGAVAGFAVFCAICFGIWLAALYLYDIDLDRTPPPHGYEETYSYTVLAILSSFILSGAVIGLWFTRKGDDKH